MDRLRGLIESKLDTPEVDRGRELIALNARHRRAIEQAEAALQRAEGICIANPDIFGSVEILACELREVSDQLAVITGAVHPEDLLARVFGRFCIGK